MSDDYTAALKDQLSRYKQKTLGIAEDGTWQKGSTRQHILPKSEEERNILPVIEQAFWEWHGSLGSKAPKKHRDFAHLNSSQAMCFNLFFPCIEPRIGPSHLLLTAFDLAGSEVREAEFEKVLNPEERTNLDFYFETDSGERVLVEAKLTERRFGTAPADKAHLTKRDDTYRERLEGRVDRAMLEDKGFTANYQLLRNLWTLETQRDLLVFLFPAERAELRREVQRFLEKVRSPWREQIQMVFMEDLCARLRALSAQQGVDRVRVAMEQFAEKYCPGSLPL